MFNKKNLLLSFIIFVFAISFASSECISEEVVYNKININTADRFTLLRLTGVDFEDTDAIIKYREKKGNFKKVEELMYVPGIDKETFKNIRNSITVESKEKESNKK